MIFQETLPSTTIYVTVMNINENANSQKSESKKCVKNSKYIVNHTCVISPNLAFNVCEISSLQENKIFRYYIHFIYSSFVFLVLFPNITVMHILALLKTGDVLPIIVKLNPSVLTKIQSCKTDSSI